MAACLICDRIEGIKHGTNPYFVEELETGYVVIGDHQFFRGYSLLLAKRHVRELHELDWSERTRFLQDMALTSEAVQTAFSPRKLNYELLGNADAHMHWHLFPRHADDPNPTNPVWEINQRLTRSDQVRPAPTDLEELTSRLRQEVRALRARYRGL
jgi:diadenosine tetraphosphate (Ap4A) HIT family hydrolase